MAAVTAPFGVQITSAVFGTRYNSAGHLMSVLMLAVPFTFVFWISWFSLFAYQRERDVLRVGVGGGLAAAAAALIVIPGNGARGAAWVYTGVLTGLALATFAVLRYRAAQLAADAPAGGPLPSRGDSTPLEL
jgi:O-antigen/teichoic acid export membrane protein